MISRRPNAPVGEPHYVDYWAGRQFTPGRSAAAGGVMWIAEGLLPLLARVELATGEVAGPYAFDRRYRPSGEVRAIAATDEAVWIRRDGELVRVDARTCKVRSVAVDGGTALAVSPQGAWVLTRAGRVGRVDLQAASLDLLGEPEQWRSHIGYGLGAIWTLAWIAGGQATLSRLDPASGAVTACTTVDGSPKSLIVDSSGVWIRVWRGRVSTDVLIRIDPETMKTAGERRVEPIDTPLVVRDGTIWISTADPHAHAERGRPTTVRRLDGHTGAVLGSYDIPGQIGSMVGHEGGIAGLLARRGEPPAAIEFTNNRSEPRFFSLDAIDVSAHLPPPPPRIEAAPTEQAVRDRLAAALCGEWIQTDTATGVETRVPYIAGVEFIDVRIEGQFPATAVVALFRSADHPGVTFGRRQRIWTDDGALSTVIDVMDVNLKERIQACGYGLPSHPYVDHPGIAWV